MKYITVLLVLICTGFVGISQEVLNKIKTDSVKLVAKYNLYNGYQNDSAYTNLMPCVLYIGKDMTLSVYEIQKVADVMKNSVTLVPTDPAVKKAMDEQFQNSEEIKRSLTASIIKLYNSPRYYMYKYADDKDLLVVDTSNFSWTLTSESKKIEGFNCQKAVLSTDSKIVAWFTRDIPVYAGPGYISGLPGLVLEYYNPGKAVAYKVTALVSTNIPQNKFRDIPKGVILVSKSEFEQLAKKDELKTQRIKQMIEGGKKN